MLDEIKNLIKNRGVRNVLILFTDITGQLRTMHMSADRLLKKLRDEEPILGFDGSSIDGFLGVESSDAELMLDEASVMLLPKELLGSETIVLFGDIISGEENYCPRRITKKVEDITKAFGFMALISLEVEFFLLKEVQIFKNKTLTRGKRHLFASIESLDAQVLIPEIKNAYMTSTHDMTLEYRTVLHDILNRIGIDIDRTHHEVAVGQIEFSLSPQNILATADRYQIFKFVAKTLARNMGFRASFMPKIFPDENGSGLHVHISLWSGNKNVFYDDVKPKKLSNEALWFIGGILKHAKALSAFLAPTINSYKRLLPGFEAPTYICWGFGNRSALIRVPSYKHINDKTRRIEIRFPDPSVNPYLALSAIIVAGLDGIKNKIDPGQAVEENVYELSQRDLIKRGIETLPRDLEEALEHLSTNKTLRSYLGSELIDRYIQVKKKELLSYKKYVTIWEYIHYIDI